MTNFGKFSDPLADKILVLAAMLCLVQNGLCDCIIVIVVLFREFAVSSVRLIAASEGKVVAANIWGKVKTVTQMVAIITIFVMQIVLEILALCNITAAGLADAFFIAGEVLLWISTIFCIISGVIYIKQNSQFISLK